jgi:hypothetical protein
MTGGKLEAMYRVKLGQMADQEPLELAFISHEDWHCGGKIIARIRNRAAESVADVGRASTS